MKKLQSAFCAALMATTAFVAAPALASEQGDFLIRLRGIGVLPDEDGSSNINGSPEIDNDFVPEVDFTYFFTDNIAAELILATTQHDVKWNNSSVASQLDLGDVRLLPPTLTLQYHFNDVLTPGLKPYLGAGINYTVFYDEKVGNGFRDIDYDDSFGAVFQAGVDYELNDSWSVNLDVKHIMLNTDVRIDTGASIVDADVDIDPWIVGIGVGYRF
ncbi:OmpW/AlkL family protein [Kiloniella sp. b19]|uniref:OmpW/AlkL family protein n=1 Tax=Kiloniella sp. GXU_MW_B19 TaxID=3141326 RepID=UPI0031D45CF2